MLSSITKIKKDDLGLYVNAGGFLCRPFFGTCFREGDEVKSHHLGGTRVGVGLPGHAMFKKEDTFEYWSITGTGMWEKRYPDRWVVDGVHYKRWNNYVRACAEFYWKYGRPESANLVKHNIAYARDRHRKLYASKAYYGCFKGIPEGDE